MVNAQIAGVVGQNAAENNYLSDAQAAQEQKELKQCTNIGCTAKVKTQWAAINVAQQASFTAGIAVGLPAGAIEPIQELVQMATNPGETYEALKGLFTSGNILGNVSDAVKESYISRLDKLEEEYQRAGASGSYNAGIETGKLLLDMASLATGVGGAAKAGIKVTEKAITKVANAAKKEIVKETSSSIPALPSAKKGSVIRNALEDHEYQQALDIVKYKGGTFKGAEKANFQGIDGWLDGIPVQLKEVQGKSIHAVRRNIVDGAKDMSKAGYEGDLYIDASKTGVSMKEMIDHFKPGSPVSNITKEGTVKNIHIKTQDGWLNVTNGSIIKSRNK